MNEQGHLQYARFTLKHRIKRLLRNLDSAWWKWRHDK